MKLNLATIICKLGHASVSFLLDVWTFLFDHELEVSFHNFIRICAYFLYERLTLIVYIYVQLKMISNKQHNHLHCFLGLEEN